MDHRVSTRLTPGELRKFGLTVGTTFVALSVFSWWGGRHRAASILVTVGSVLIVFGLIAPKILDPVYRAWMGLAKILSRVTTPIFLGVVYFLILTPVGVVRRILRKNALDRPLTSDSYWVPRATRKGGDMDRLF